MSDTLPAIFASRSEVRRETPLGRVLALAVSLGCLALLARAATLTPSPSGMGTHLAMGMGRCGFLERTGLPCPSCGMTTSFAWLTRGNAAASLYVQPMGTLLAVAAAITTWAGLYIAITGRPVYCIVRLLPARFAFLSLVGFAILAWAWKILLTMNGWDGWRA
jgi:hypothetical protein